METICVDRGTNVSITFVAPLFSGDTKAKTKVQQSSLTPLFYDLRICEPYVFNAYGFHMRWSLPPVWDNLPRRVEVINGALQAKGLQNTVGIPTDESSSLQLATTEVITWLPSVIDKARPD
jgi:hypothetical protein